MPYPFNTNAKPTRTQAGGDVESLDSWEYLLDRSPCMGIMQARSNWAARLAATSILIQQDSSHTAVFVGDGKICWRCLEELYSDPESRMPQAVIY